MKNNNRIARWNISERLRNSNFFVYMDIEKDIWGIEESYQILQSPKSMIQD